ncbi:hypothetical protein [Oharaeibacter diazotrophicus]|nr:hypothetical protein [Oharaeibacter diazotrophicus]
MAVGRGGVFRSAISSGGSFMRSLVALSVLGVALSTSAVPAAADGLERVVVAATGHDSASCGLPTTPCRQFQKALERVLPGGIVVTAGPGSYGTMKITKSVSVLNDGAGIAMVEGGAGQPVIEVNVPDSGPVVLRGLTIDGRDAASAGISFAAGGHLLVSKSFIKGSKMGIRIAPQFGGSVTIEDSLVTNNGTGVASSGASPGQLSVVLNHVTISATRWDFGDGIGLRVVGRTGAKQFVAMTDTTISNNNMGPLGAGVGCRRGRGDGDQQRHRQQ